MKVGSFKLQKGFTLVEIAIVLVIIGLLLGGVLKGQEMIESGRVKSATSTFNAVTSAVASYRDRYRNLPGDDCCVLTKQARGGSWVAAMNGTGQDAAANGIVDDATVAAWNQWNGWQHVTFWLDLYAGGFLSGNPTARNAEVFLRNPWGGAVDIVNAGQTYGMPNNALVLCMNSVPGKAAAQLDVSLDDGLPASGSLRGAVANAPAAAVPAATPYAEDSSYTVCKTV
jgi:prepilin-type N-terminal cleavage/methylation domain-containing protein